MLETPEFKSEQEEALWWENQALLLKEFKQAQKDGTLGHGTLAAQGLTGSGLVPITTIRLSLPVK